MTAAATLSMQKPDALLAIFWGGFICGCLDITAALAARRFLLRS